MSRALEAAKIADRLRNELAAIRHHFQTTSEFKKLPNFQSDHAKKVHWPLIEQHLLVSLSVTLFKVIEFYEKYQSYLPNTAKETLKEMYIELLQRGVRDFRHQFCGHIQNQKTKSIITDAQLTEHFRKFSNGQNFEEIGQWLWNMHDNNPKTAGCLSSKLEIISIEIYSMAELA